MNKILFCLSFIETANMAEHTGQDEKHVSNDNSSGQSYNGKCYGFSIATSSKPHTL